MPRRRRRPFYSMGFARSAGALDIICAAGEASGSGVWRRLTRGRAQACVAWRRRAGAGREYRGATIAMKDAKNLLGFTFFEVYSSTLKTNVRYVEAALQMRYQHLPLGLRLWRHPDKGKKFDTKVDGKLHKVFIACSPRVAQISAR